MLQRAGQSDYGYETGMRRVTDLIEATASLASRGSSLYGADDCSCMGFNIHKYFGTLLVSSLLYFWRARRCRGNIGVEIESSVIHCTLYSSGMRSLKYKATTMITSFSLCSLKSKPNED